MMIDGRAEWHQTFKISSSKYQAPNNKQASNSKFQTRIWCFGHWDLSII